MELKEKVTEVVAALIWRDDSFLICQRPANKARGLMWEFAGGKIEEGETRCQALKRECMEELGVEVQPGEIFMEVLHRYPDILVHLTLFNAEIVKGEPVMLEHADMRWITKDQIPKYRFCPADKDILDKLMEG